MINNIQVKLSFAKFISFAFGLLISISTACAADPAKNETRFKTAEQKYLLAKSNFESALSALKTQQERVKQEKIILKMREQEFNQARINLNRTSAVFNVERQRK